MKSGKDGVPALLWRVVVMLVPVLPVLPMGGCAGQQSRSDSAAPALKHPPILAPATLGASRTAQQVLRGAFGEHEVTLRCVVIASPEKIDAIVLTATGQRALTLGWDGAKWQVEAAPMVPSQLNAEQLLADLQFSLWPLRALQAAYASQGWEVSEPGGGIRRLRHNGQLFEEAHYTGSDPWQSRLWLVNFRYGYSLGVEPEGK